jgi:hypothetical protein
MLVFEGYGAIIGPCPRRAQPPWSIEECQESFIVTDANGQHLAYVYFEDESSGRCR